MNELPAVSATTVTTYTSTFNIQTTTTTSELTTPEKTLWEAAKSGDILMLKKWIEEKKLSVDQKNEYGETPLMLAVQHADIDTIKWLVANKADVFVKNAYGATLDFIAAKRGDRQICEFLLEKMSLYQENIETLLKSNLSKINLAESLIKTLIKALDESSSSASEQAVNALVQLGEESPEVIAALVKIFGDSKVRMYVAFVLVQLGKESPEIIAELMTGYEHKARDTVKQAISTLGNLKQPTPEVISHLISLLGDSDSDVRTQAAAALVNLKQTSPQAITAMIQALKGNNFEPLITSMLVKLGKESPEVIVALIKGLEDSDLSIATQSASALIQLEVESSEVIAVLTKALCAKEWYVRRDAATALGNLKKILPDVIVTLINALKDNDKYVRARVVAALVKLGGKESVEVSSSLINALEDKDSFVRMGAASALGSSKQAVPDIITALTKALINSKGSRNQNFRTQVACALVELGEESSESMATLIKALEGTGNYELRTQIVSVLGSLKQFTPEVISALIKVVFGDKGSAVTEKALSVLGKLRQSNADSDIVTALIKALRDSNSSVRGRAAAELGNRKQILPDIIAALIETLGDSDYFVLLNTLSALGALKQTTSDVISALIKTCGNKEAKIRIESAIVLVQLGKESSEVITDLNKAFNDDNDDIRTQAASALVQLGEESPEVITVLTKALKDSNSSDIREQSASALGSLKNTSAEVVTALINATGDEDYNVRGKALYSLGKIGQSVLFLLYPLQKTLLRYFDFPPETLNEFGTVEVDVHSSLLLWKGCIKKGFVTFLKSSWEEFSKDFNHVDVNGNTWLHIAASFNQPGMAEFLIGRGMDTSLKNKARQTSYELALEKGHLVVAQMIVGLKPAAIAEKDVDKELNPDGNPKVLGSGSFGTVYKATWNHSEVAYKQLHAGLTELSGSVFEEFRSEVNLLAGSQHANVVRMYGITLSPLGLVMEWVQKGSLRAILNDQKAHKFSPFSWSEKIIISQDIAKGLTFLHSEQINLAHRDLKADNVLLDENNHAKLTDFGFAQVKSSNVAKAEKAAAGSLPWIAPEALQTPPIQTTHSDMYSYGTVLWEITTLDMPYANMQTEVIRTQVLAHQTPALPESAPKAWNELIQKCWTVDPKERPTAPQAVKYLSDHRSDIVPSTQQDNAAVLHFKGLDKQEKDQQKTQTAYTHTTLNYLLPMLENTAHMILYAASAEEDVKDIITHVCILSKALGRPALVVFASSSGLTCGALIAGQQLIWVDPRGKSPDVEQRAIFETLLQEEVLEDYYVSKTPLLNQDWEMTAEQLSAQSGAVLIEWSRGILQRPLTQFMSWVEKLPKEKGETENSKRHAPVDIQAMSSSSLKTLQLQNAPEKVSQQLEIFRQQHLAVLQLQPGEAVSRNEASSEKDYVESCDNALPRRIVKFTILALKNKPLLKAKEKIQAVRSSLHVEKDTNYSLELKKLNATLTEKTNDNVSAPEILSSEIVLTKKLGEGNFGEVHKGVWEKTPVAVKRLKGQNIPPNLIAEFKNEAALLASLNHPNIVHLYGICTDMPESPFCLVLEFASGGGLDGKLRDSTNTPKAEMLTWEVRQRIAFDIARGVSYLHKHKVIHGDLRTCNILVDENNRAKLGDFGLAKQRTANMSLVMTNERTSGVIAWLSPELEKTGKKTESSDVYSFGMVLWELMTGKIPFDGYSEETIGNVISSGDILSYHPIPPDAPQVLATLMKKCLSRKPEDRPKMREVVETLFKALEPEEYKAYRQAKSVETESTPIVEILEAEETEMDRLENDHEDREIEDIPEGIKGVEDTPEEDSGIEDNPEEVNGIEDTPEEEVNHLTEFSPGSSFLFGAFFNQNLRNRLNYQENGEYISSYLQETDRTSMACITRSSYVFFKSLPARQTILETDSTPRVELVEKEDKENISEQGKPLNFEMFAEPFNKLKEKMFDASEKIKKTPRPDKEGEDKDKCLMM